MKKLSPSQARLLEVIKRLTRDMGMSPTLQELADDLGIKPPSVYDGILRLEKKGLIRKLPGKKRGIRILNNKTRIIYHSFSELQVQAKEEFLRQNGKE